MKKNLIKKILSQKIVKYFFGGGIAALIDLSCLYLFVDIFHIYLYLGVVLAFCISFLLGFLYQKYITFINYDKKHVSQGTLFLIFQLTGLGINTLLLYIFVDKFGFYYMYVAVLNKFIIFVWNYTMNNYFNFK